MATSQVPPCPAFPCPHSLFLAQSPCCLSMEPSLHLPPSTDAGEAHRWPDSACANTGVVIGAPVLALCPLCQHYDIAIGLHCQLSCSRTFRAPHKRIALLGKLLGEPLQCSHGKRKNSKGNPLLHITKQEQLNCNCQEGDG